MYTIIEDCSPYYIRFKFDGMDKIIDICREELSRIERKRKFQTTDLSEEGSAKVLALLPMSKVIELMPRRVSMFITQGGKKPTTHKDGVDHRMSINIPVQILDDKCITKWYSDEDLAQYTAKIIEPKLNKTTRSLETCDTDNHTPLKSWVMRPDECVLFNTDIWHDFDNRPSPYERVMLTVRAVNPGNMYFEDARRILFGC